MRVRQTGWNVLGIVFATLLFVQSKVYAAMVEPIATGYEIPKLDLPLKQNKRIISAIEKVDIKNVPQLTQVPPYGMAAFLGQTMVLNAKVIEPKDKVEPAQVAWVVNGRVICTQLKCEIPLDGKILDVGAHSLVLVAYNIYGSSQSKHLIRVVSGNWNRTLPFNKSFKKEIPTVSYTDGDISVIDKNALNISTINGNGVFAYPEHLVILGSVPRNIPWVGRLQTTTNGVAKIVDPGKVDLFALGITEVQFDSTSANSSLRKVNLVRGGMRARAVTKESKEQVIQIQTDELGVYGFGSADFYVSRVAEQVQETNEKQEKVMKKKIGTHVIVVSGKVNLKFMKPVPGRANEAELLPGIDFVIYQDGSVPALKKPESTRMERLLQLTMSQTEWKDKLAKMQERKKTLVLNDHLAKVEELISREEYFDVVAELMLVEDRKTEDIRIPYLFGIAYKGIYQSKDAKKYLEIAANQDKTFVQAPWELAQLYLDEKKWEEAASWLDEARDRMDTQKDEKLIASYHYYSGVTSFNLGNEFWARSAFTQALWEKDLDPALRGSSGGFLQNLAKKKPLTVIVPVGLQFDGNALSVPVGGSIPEPYDRKTAFRSIIGAIVNYDPATSQGLSDYCCGGGAKLIYVKTFPAEFKVFDAVVGEVSLSQNTEFDLSKHKPFDSKNKAEPNTQPLPKTIKTVEYISAIYNNKKIITQTFGLTASYGKLELGLAFERDPVNTGDANRNAILGKQGFGMPLFAFERMMIDEDFLLEERYSLNKNVTNGHEINFTTTPSLSIQLSTKMSLKNSLTLGLQYIKPTTTTTINTKVSPAVSLVYPVLPWLMTIVGANFDYAISKTDTGSTKSIKPGASLMLTGIF